MLFPNPYPGYVDPNAPAGYRGVYVAGAPLPVDLNAGAPLVSTPTIAPPQSVSPAPPLTSVPAAPVATPAAPAPAVGWVAAAPLAVQPAPANAAAQVNPQVAFDASLADATIKAALANVQAGVAAACVTLNAGLKSSYLQSFADWLISWTATRITDPSTAPKPPASYVVGASADSETTGPGMIGPNSTAVVQWAFPVQSGPPVCAMPAIPGVAPHATGTMLIGKQTAAPGWFACLPGDITPAGTTNPGTSQDGITGLFQKVGSPVGSGAGVGWFQLISKG